MSGSISSTVSGIPDGPLEGLTDDQLVLLGCSIAKNLASDRVLGFLAGREIAVTVNGRSAFHVFDELRKRGVEIAPGVLRKKDAAA